MACLAHAIGNMQVSKSCADHHVPLAVLIWDVLQGTPQRTELFCGRLRHVQASTATYHPACIPGPGYLWGKPFLCPLRYSSALRQECWASVGRPVPGSHLLLCLQHADPASWQ